MTTLPIALVLALTIVGIASSPRRGLDRRTIATALCTMAALLAIVIVGDPVAVAALLPVSLLPCWLALTTLKAPAELRGACRWLLAGTVLPMMVALGCAVVGYPRAAAVTVALGLLVRMGVPPFHSWMPVALEYAPLPLLVATAPIAPFVIVRAVLPAAPDLVASAQPMLVVLGTVGAAYGAIMGVAQVHLRRAIGSVLVSQWGSILVAMAVATPESLAGALVASLALGLTGGGLIALTWAIESRVGTASMAELGGLVARTPHLASAFLILAFAHVGFPGGLGFVAEDVMLHGILEPHPIVGACILAASALNAITMFRAYQQVFLGPLPADGRFDQVEDLVTRERIVAVVVAAAVMLGGIAPAVVLRQVGTIAVARSLEDVR